MSLEQFFVLVVVDYWAKLVVNADSDQEQKRDV